ncbi:hypothetical protein V6C27_05970 [Peptococcaceae bacterium 1198_IL3148]
MKNKEKNILTETCPDILNYLKSYPAQNIRSRTLLMILLIDLILGWPLVLHSTDNIFIYLLIPIAVINIWGFTLIFKPYRKQLQYMLFLGVAGLVTSLCSITLTQKMAYLMLGIKTPLYCALTFAGYVIILISYINHHLNTTEKELGKKFYKKLNTQNIGPITLCSSVIYLLANLSMSFMVNNNFLVFLMTLYLLFSLIFMYFILYIHNYFFIRNNINLVDYSSNNRNINA